MSKTTTSNTSIINVTDSKGVNMKVNLDNTREFCRFFGLKGADMNWDFISKNPEVLNKLITKATSPIDSNKPGLGLTWTNEMLVTPNDFYDLCKKIAEVGVDCEYITEEEYILADKAFDNRKAKMTEEVISNLVDSSKAVEVETVNNATVSQSATEKENNMNNTTNRTEGTTSQERIENIAAKTYNFLTDNAQKLINEMGKEIAKSKEVYNTTIAPDLKEKTTSAWEKAQDEKIAGNLKKVTDCLQNIKKLSCASYFKLVDLYEKDGWVRTIEIHNIIEEGIHTGLQFAMFPKTVEEYKEEGKKLCAAMASLRKAIRKGAAKVRELLGVDVKGTIANKVYGMLRKVASLLVFGARVVISVGLWVFSAITSVAIFIGGIAFKGISWLVLYVKGAILNKKHVTPATDKFEDEDDEDIELEDEVDFIKRRNAERNNPAMA